MRRKMQIRLILLMGMAWGGLFGCQTAQLPHEQNETAIPSEDRLLQGFAQLSTSSISDAIDQITGKRGYMSHEIRHVFTTKICGRAVTVLARPSSQNEPPKIALELIDTEPPGKVLVIVMEGPDGANVAAFGGIMGTGAQMRGFAGAVLDGGCRDVSQLQAMKFPVFSRGIVPSNSVGRYINVARNESVLCGGIPVRANDIVVGDMDGVVVIPQEREEEILRLAQELEKKEAETIESVKKLKSIQNASQKHNRI